MTSRCPLCLGDEKRAPWPEDPKGCRCAAKAKIGDQRGYVQKNASAGSMTSAEYAAYLRANEHWPAPQTGENR